MRSQRIPRLFLALLGGSTACSYDPHPKDGQEACSLVDSLCPYGYQCYNGLCYSAGHVPVSPGTGGAVSSSKPGSSGAGGTGGVIHTGGVTGGAGVISVGGLIVPRGGAGIPDAGGGLSTGGTVGSGGATTCTPGKASGFYPLIDNMADGDTGIIPQDGRSGGWYTYGDSTGTITPPTPSLGMMCASGSGFSIWGAGLGVSFDAVPTKTCTYDASIYTGIRFTITPTSTVSSGTLRFAVQTADIAEAVSGGTCVSTSALTDNCNDIYGVDLLVEGTVVNCQSAYSSWVCGPATGAAGPITVTVPFSYMSQEGWGRVFPKFDRTLMLGLQWQFKNCSSAGVCVTLSSFNVCVGDLSFY